MDFNENGIANGLGDWGSIPCQVIPKTQSQVESY